MKHLAILVSFNALILSISAIDLHIAAIVSNGTYMNSSDFTFVTY
jgi:hypothetical protein